MNIGLGLILIASTAIFVHGGHKAGKKQQILEGVQENGAKLNKILSNMGSNSGNCSGGGCEKAILVAGGCTSETCQVTSVEALNADGTRLCSIPDLPSGRFLHSQSGLLICGGYDAAIAQRGAPTCVVFNSGQWFYLNVTLQDNPSRYRSTIWHHEEGVYLLGGSYTESSSEVLIGGQSQPSFNLTYDTYAACGISLDEEVIVTGGYYDLSNVTAYDENGFVSTLPSLKTGRSDHGCGAYYDDNDQVVLLVVGGNNGDYLSSTEILYYGAGASQWEYVTEYPYPVYRPRLASVDNSIISIGGYSYISTGIYHTETYAYNSVTQSWDFVDNLYNGRRSHTVGVVNKCDIEKYCDYAVQDPETEKYSGPQPTEDEEN